MLCYVAVAWLKKGKPDEEKMMSVHLEVWANRNCGGLWSVKILFVKKFWGAERVWLEAILHKKTQIPLDELMMHPQRWPDGQDDQWKHLTITVFLIDPFLSIRDDLPKHTERQKALVMFPKSYQ